MEQFIRRMGLSAGLAGLIAATLAVLGFVANGRILLAQNGSHITVLRELEHDTSPPLDKIPPLPPEAGPKQETPFHPTHGRFAPEPEAQADQIIQSSPSDTATPSSDHNYTGLGTGFPGFSVQYIPPDTNGAVGDTQFVQWVNASFAVLDKSDGHPVLGPVAGNTLWSGFGGACQRTNSGDPIAQYDEFDGGHWVMMQPVFKSPYYVCIAVSTTSDATGSYNRYAFQIPNKLFPDYPKLGIWNDGYYLTYNQFGGNSFQGAAACALDRAAMLAGTAATMQCFTVNPSYGSLLPADFDGTEDSLPPSGSPGYFLNFDGDNKSLDLWQFHVDWSNPSNSTFARTANIPVASFSEACGGGDCIPQKGTSQTLDSLGDRLMYRLAYRNFPNGANKHESLVVSHSVDTGNGRTGVRWYELTKPWPGGAGWGVNQQSTYAPSTDSAYRWMPSIAMDKNGNIAMGYSVSSGSVSPTIRYTGRAAGDSLNEMGSEVDVLARANPAINPGSQTSYTRWGDYASMAIDPVDDCTFWFTTEYQPTNGVAWSTRIASFKFSDCSGGGGGSVPSAPPLLSATATSSSQINLSWTDNSTDEDGFKVKRCSGTNCTPSSVVATVGANITSYSDTGLSANTTYRYVVVAYNGSGDSGPSPLASATTQQLPAPSAPTNLGATAISSSQINLSWTDTSDNEDGFKIERCTGLNCSNFAQVAQVGANAESYSDITGLSASTTYTYRVRAYNAGGNSGYSNTANATTQAAPAISLTATGYKVKGVQTADLLWTGATGSVDVYRDNSKITTTSSTSYTDNINKKGAGTYNYQVCGAGSKTTCSNTATVTF
jgi:hypothetical protein